MKKLVSYILTLALLLGAFPPFGGLIMVAEAVVVEPTIAGDCINVTWKLDDNGVLTLSPTDPSRTAKIGAYEFTGDAYYDYYYTDTPWFSYRSSIKKVVVEEGITEIGTYAFAFLYNLEEVSLPDGLLYIRDSAFRGYYDRSNDIRSNKLTEVIFPDSLQSIGQYAFRQCANLERVDFPDSLYAIGKEAFCECSSLSAITYGGLTSIPKSAFGRCAFSDLVISDGITSIETWAFFENDLLTSVTIPDSVTSIDTLAFSGNLISSAQPFPDNLTDIYYNGTQEQWEAIDGLPQEDADIFSQVTIHFLEDPSDTEKTPTTQILTPVLDEITNPEEGLTISWLRPLNTEDVEYVADGYYVYRKTAGDSYSKIATLSGIDNTSYTDTNVTHGTVYTYTVAAYYNGQTGSRDETGLTATYIGPLADVIETDAAKLAVWFDEDVDVMYETFSGTVNGHFTLWIDTQVKELTTPVSYQPGPVTLDIKLTGGYSFAPNSKVQTKTITTQTLSATTANPHPKVRESLEIYILNGQTGTIQVTASAPTCVSASTQAICPVMRFMDFEEDGWAVINDRNCFCYSSTYEIPLKRYQEVYGDKIGALMYEAEHASWGGNCAGLAWTAAFLATRGMNLPSGYSGVVNQQADGVTLGYAYWKSGSKLTQLAEQYQLFQAELRRQDMFSMDLLASMPEEYYQYDAASKTYTHRSNGNYIQTIYNAIKNSTQPLEATVSWDGNAHTVIIYSNELRSEGDGWYSTPVYDSNHPYLDEDYYITSVKCSAYVSQPQRLWLNPTKNLFQAYMGPNASGVDQVRGSQNNVAITHGTKRPDTLIVAKTMTQSLKEIDPEAWFKLYQKTRTALTYTADTTLTLADASAPDDIVLTIQNGQVTCCWESLLDIPKVGGGGTVYLPSSTVYRIGNASGRYSLQTGEHIVIVNSVAHGLTYDPDTNQVNLTPQANGTASVTLSNLNGVDDVQAVQVSGTVQSGKKVISYALDGDHLLTVDGDENLNNPKVSILEDEFTQVPNVDLSRPVDVEDPTAVVDFTGRMVVLDADADVEIAEEDLNSYVMIIEGGTVVKQATWLTDITVEVKDGKQYINILDGWYTLHITGSSASDIVVMDSDESGKISRTVTFDDVELSNEDVKLSVNCDAVGQKYTLVQGSKTIQPTSDTAELKLAFVDVKSTDYFYDPVRWAVANGITSGTSSTIFSPHEACTRAQAVTFLWRAAGRPEPDGTRMPFTDVEKGNFYYKAVLWAVEQGITSGTSATTFSPNTKCTRAEIVTFLWRADDTSPELTGSTDFSDVSVSAYYWFPVRWAVKEGIACGTSETTFSPNEHCTRAQIVTFLYRALAM